jgi:hypothetical protein
MSGLPIPGKTQHELMAAKQNAANKPSSGKRVALPNGRFADYASLVDQTYIPQDHTSIFADPKKFMKNPRPDCMYSWVDYKKEAAVMGKIRSGAYRPVELEECFDDKDIPLFTHTMPGKISVVCVYDVALMEVQPRAVAEMYKWREKLAIDRTVNNVTFEQFRSTLERMTNGGAVADCEITNLNPK